MRSHHRGSVGCGLILLLLSGSFGAYGQIILDGTLGPRGALQGPNYQISAQYGQQRGGNLFHSFGVFNVNTNKESATFSGPNSVQNIISRVTWGSPSSINGTLRSTIPNANLFLLNPAGVLFGPNAKLDVSGSFHVSTADYLRLGENDRFYVNPTKNSVLSVAPVTAFGFLSQTPSPITVQSSFLHVSQGQTLSLIGGDLTLTDATLYAPAGRINLAAVGSAGAVVPTNTDLGMQGFGKWGAITIEHPSANRVMVDLGQSFGRVSLGDVDTSGAAGGAIFIRGGQWVSRGGWGLADTYGGRDGRGVDMILTGTAQFERGSRLTAFTFGAGRAGNITLTADDAVTLTDNSFMGTRAEAGSTGNAGDITLNGLDLRGGSQINTSAYQRSTGNAGNINLATRSLSLTGGGQITSSTKGAGRAGNITLTARDAVTISGDSSSLYANAEPGSTSNAGNINLATGSLSLTGGGQIFADTYGGGRGGNITLTARDAVTISGTSPAGDSSGLSAGTAAGSTGDAGTITLNVGRLDLSGGSGIFAGTYGGGRGGNITLSARDAVTLTDNSFMGTRAEAGSTGNAGDITLNVGRLDLSGGSRISTSTWGARHGGDITLSARDAVTISGTSPAGAPSGVFASAEPGSTGGAGAITLDVGRLDLSGGGQIVAQTFGMRRGGNITLSARDAVTLTDNSFMGTRAEAGSTGNAGDITLNVGCLNLNGGSQITSSTWSAGRGGKITLTARDAVTISGTSPAGDLAFSGVFADSKLGSTHDAGAITLDVGRLDLSGGGRITSSTQSAGRGGEITLTARDAVTISGTSPAGYPSGLFANTEAGSKGDAGTITLDVGRLDLSGGGWIVADTQSAGRGGNITLTARDAVTISGTSPAGVSSVVRASTEQPGSPAHAGNIKLTTGSLSLTGGGQLVSSTRSAGRGGEITLTARDAVTISGTSPAAGHFPSRLFASSELGSTGNAGNINLTTDRLILDKGTTINAGSILTSGGNIFITARDTRLSKNSTITSSVQGNEQSDGGNVTLNGDQLIVYDGGKITARANQGRGGRITLNENVFLHEAPRAIPDVLDASSQVVGNQGEVTINAQDLNISSTLVALPATYLDASKLLSNRCTAPRAGGRSSFVVRGRGAVPPGPEGPTPALAQECLPAAAETAEPVQQQAPAVETTETHPHFGS